MSLRILSLPFNVQSNSFDTKELDRLQQTYTVISSQHLFFMSESRPCLTLILTLNPKPITQKSQLSPKNQLTPKSPKTQVTPKSQTLPEPRDSAKSQFNEKVAKSTPKTADLLEELPTADQEIFKRLQIWRKEQALNDGVPPYVVFTNKELLAIVRNRPNTEAAMQKIDGIGKKKSHRYARTVIEILNAKSNAALSENPESKTNNDT